MENENYESVEYSFLSEPNVEKHFADINILLLSGTHIDQAYPSLFSAIEAYETQWQRFYENLYKLNLVPDVFDGHRYYYLDFFDTGKGKLVDTSRHIELTALQTVVGLMLLDMYYQKYFDNPKTVHWIDIKRQILEGDHQDAYKRIIFNDIREAYDEKEWTNAEGRFKSAINSFERLGWVSKQSTLVDELIFEIRPAIHRLAKLYTQELNDFDLFSKHLKNEE